MPPQPKAKTQKPNTKPSVAGLSIDERRLEKLKAIKAKLELGVHVQNRDLQTWLTKAEFESIAERWEYEKGRREAMYGEKPSEVKEYEERLAKAIFTFNRSEHYSTRGKSVTAKKLSDKAESEFESALEWLDECYSLDKNIRMWIDRDIDLRECTLDPDGVPRVITSRSLLSQKGVSTQTIADIKLSIVNDALDQLTAPKKDNGAGEEARKKLEGLLKLKSIDDFDF